MLLIYNVERNMCETMQYERIDARRYGFGGLFPKVYLIRRDHSETRIYQENNEG